MRGVIVRAAFAVVAAGACLFAPHNSLATGVDVSPWVNSGLPTLTTLRSNIPWYQIPTTTASGNQDCTQDQKIILRPAKLADPLSLKLSQSEISTTDCTVKTNYGYVDRNYRLTQAGGKAAGNVYTPSGRQVPLSPIPNSNTGYTLDPSAPVGSYMTLINGVSGRLTPVINPSTEEVRYTISDSIDTPVLDEKGKKLDIKYDTMSFSQNGEWAVFDAPGIGMTRLHITTGQIFIFAPGYFYNNGSNPGLQTAITSNGRYAVVVANDNQVFRVYDLENCTPSTGADLPASCQSKDYRNFIMSTVPGNNGKASQVRFNDDYSFRFYGAININGAITRYQYLLTAPGQSVTKFGYLALGDSFSSGEGAYFYKPGTDVKSPLNKCHLSTRSYPFVLGENLGLNQYNSIACSGAKIKDTNGLGFRDEQHYNLDGPQAYGLTKDTQTPYILDNFLVGYRQQLQFVNKYKPSIITMSMGGNDIGFSDIVKACINFGTCKTAPSQRIELAQGINAQFDNLVTLYKQLQDASAGAKIYIVGYPSLVKEDGNCALNVLANSQELVFFNQATTYLNYVIKQATIKAGVNYVDVQDALYGHRLCETKSSDAAANGLTIGNDTALNIGPIGNESYHPNELGHKLYADKIAAQTDSFTKPNPIPELNTVKPDLYSANDILNLGLPQATAIIYDQTNRTYVYNDIFTPDVLLKDSPNHIHLDGIKPFGTVPSEIQSTPTPLGTFTASADGTIDTNIDIPDSIEPGYHTLHFYASTPQGEPLDIQKIVYVGETSADLDGDDTLDSSEQCVGIEPSGQDQDKDGIDDACDGFIGEAPPEPAPTPAPPPSDPIVLPPLPTDPIIVVPPTPDEKLGLNESSPETESPYAEAPPVATGSTPISTTVTQASTNTPLQAPAVVTQPTATPPQGTTDLLPAESNLLGKSKTEQPKTFATRTDTFNPPLLSKVVFVALGLSIFGFLVRWLVALVIQ